MRVRASRPNFWVGQTYDYWNGQSWLQAQNPANGGHLARLDFGSPFEIPLQSDQQAPLAPGTADIQTFYLAESGRTWSSTPTTPSGSTSSPARSS